MSFEKYNMSRWYEDCLGLDALQNFNAGMIVIFIAGFEEAEDYIGQRSRLKLERSLSRHSTDSRSSLSPRTPE